MQEEACMRSLRGQLRRLKFEFQNLGRDNKLPKSQKNPDFPNYKNSSFSLLLDIFICGPVIANNKLFDGRNVDESRGDKV